MTDKDQEQFFGSQLPGTGGDFIDGSDVEGHYKTMLTDDGSEDIAMRNPRIPVDDGSDVEGHLYHGGPSTQGEIIARGPHDNPHGER
jgi:hypothetical protein